MIYNLISISVALKLQTEIDVSHLSVNLIHQRNLPIYFLHSLDDTINLMCVNIAKEHIQIYKTANLIHIMSHVFQCTQTF